MSPLSHGLSNTWSLLKQTMKLMPYTASCFGKPSVFLFRVHDSQFPTALRLARGAWSLRGAVFATAVSGFRDCARSCDSSNCSSFLLDSSGSCWFEPKDLRRTGEGQAAWANAVDRNVKDLTIDRRNLADVYRLNVDFQAVCFFLHRLILKRSFHRGQVQSG